MKTKTALAVLAALGGADAFWRMECHGTVGVARIDPLVNPGEVAQHVHAIHGSSGFSETATYEDLINGQCTSCAVRQDKSAYWAPALYFQHDDGTFEYVNQVGGMLAYYFLNTNKAPNADQQIVAFPKGFRMIAGDSLRRNYTVGNPREADPEKSRWAALGQTTQGDLEQRALGFNCLNYKKDPEGSLARHYLPEKEYLDQNCADGIRIELMFPSCWNGKDLDSPDHKSHVAFPDLVMDGGCPPGFPVKLPGLFYETIWDTGAFTGKPGRFVLSNGDVHGFGYHGDFIMGWEDGVLQKAVNTCTNPSGKIYDCPIFDIQPRHEEESCRMQTPVMLKNEMVVGKVGAGLPGGVMIQEGPAPATAKHPVSETASVSIPTVTYTPGVKPTGTLNLPGQILHETTSSTSSSADIQALAQPTTTPAPIPTPEDDGKYSIVRTEYITEGNVVNMIVVKEAVEYVTVTSTTVLAPKARRHLHRHGRRHHH
ncbi:protein of unknown function (DUF1996) domain containing protein [Naviculisporaceae sp. PSN 640]